MDNLNLKFKFRKTLTEVELNNFIEWLDDFGMNFCDQITDFDNYKINEDKQSFEVLLDNNDLYEDSLDVAKKLIEEFRDYVLPYLNETEVVDIFTQNVITAFRNLKSINDIVF